MFFNEGVNYQTKILYYFLFFLHDSGKLTDFEIGGDLVVLGEDTVVESVSNHIPVLEIGRVRPP